MFGLFKKKSQLEILKCKYEKLMEASFILSKSNRKAADQKFADAEAVMVEIEKLKL